MRLEHIVTTELGKINYEDGTWVATAQDHAQWQYLTLELVNEGILPVSLLSLLVQYNVR
jgi:hypothetical protein